VSDLHLSGDFPKFTDQCRESTLNIYILQFRPSLLVAVDPPGFEPYVLSDTFPHPGFS